MSPTDGRPPRPCNQAPPSSFSTDEKGDEPGPICHFTRLCGDDGDIHVACWLADVLAPYFPCVPYIVVGQEPADGMVVNRQFMDCVMERMPGLVTLVQCRGLAHLVHIATITHSGLFSVPGVDSSVLVFRLVLFVDWSIARAWGASLCRSAVVPPPTHLSYATHVRDSLVAEAVVTLLRRSPSMVRVACRKEEEAVRDALRVSLGPTARIGRVVAAPRAVPSDEERVARDDAQTTGQPTATRESKSPVSFTSNATFMMRCLAVSLLGNATSMRPAQHETTEGAFFLDWESRIYAAKVWAATHAFPEAELNSTIHLVPSSTKVLRQFVYRPELGYSVLERPPISPLNLLLDELAESEMWNHPISLVTAIRVFALERVYRLCGYAYDFMCHKTRNGFLGLYEMTAVDSKLIRALGARLDGAEKTLSTRPRVFCEAVSRIMGPGLFWQTILSRHRCDDPDTETLISKWASVTPPSMIAMFSGRLLAQVMLSTMDKADVSSPEDAFDCVSCFYGRPAMGRSYVAVDREKDALSIIPDRFRVPFLVTSRLAHALVEVLGSAPGLDRLGESPRDQTAQLEKLLLSFYCSDELDNGFSCILDDTRTNYPRLYTVLCGVAQSVRVASLVFVTPCLSFEWTATKAASLMYHTRSADALQNVAITTVPVCPTCRTVCINVHSESTTTSGFRIATNPFTSHGSQGVRGVSIDIFSPCTPDLAPTMLCGKRRGALASSCHRTVLWRAPIVGSVLYCGNKAYYTCADVSCGAPFVLDHTDIRCNHIGLLCPLHDATPKGPGPLVMQCSTPTCGARFDLGPVDTDQSAALPPQRLYCPAHAPRGFLFVVNGVRHARCIDPACGTAFPFAVQDDIKTTASPPDTMLLCPAHTNTSTKRARARNGADLREFMLLNEAAANKAEESEDDTGRKRKRTASASHHDRRKRRPKGSKTTTPSRVRLMEILRSH